MLKMASFALVVVLAGCASPDRRNSWGGAAPTTNSTTASAQDSADAPKPSPPSASADPNLAHARGKGVPAHIVANVIDGAWEDVLAGLPIASGEAGQPACSCYGFLRAHASLIANENNEATAGFLRLSSPVDLKHWQEWTHALHSAHPTSQYTIYLHADALARLGHRDRAIHLLESGTREHGASALSSNALGILYTTEGLWDKALLAFDQAQQLSRSFADAHANLGILWLLRSDGLLGAERAFRRACKLNPNFSTARYGQALLSYMQGQPGEAAAFINEALRVSGPLQDHLEAMIAEALVALQLDRAAADTLVAKRNVRGSLSTDLIAIQDGDVSKARVRSFVRHLHSMRTIDPDLRTLW